MTSAVVSANKTEQRGESGIDLRRTKTGTRIGLTRDHMTREMAWVVERAEHNRRSRVLMQRAGNFQAKDSHRVLAFSDEKAKRQPSDR